MTLSVVVQQVIVIIIITVVIIFLLFIKKNYNACDHIEMNMSIVCIIHGLYKMW